VRAGAWTKIDNVISAPNRLFIVFDHKHRIAEVAQRGQRLQELLIIPRVQTDGRLVEHVKHSAQLRSNLRRKSDTLTFTTRKRRR
jgi:hypothetical protein